MISESAIFVLLAASHGIITSGHHLVVQAWSLLASAAGVVVANIEAMRPAIVHVLEVLGHGVCSPKLSFLLIELLTFRGFPMVASDGCLVIGEIMELLAEEA